MREYSVPLFAVFCFLSRIILKRLDNDQLEKFRKLERLSKNVIKANADMKFMTYKVVATTYKSWQRLQ